MPLHACPSSVSNIYNLNLVHTHMSELLVPVSLPASPLPISPSRSFEKAEYLPISPDHYTVSQKGGRTYWTTSPGLRVLLMVESYPDSLINDVAQSLARLSVLSMGLTYLYMINLRFLPDLFRNRTRRIRQDGVHLLKSAYIHPYFGKESLLSYPSRL